jgi:enoyl-CoA hydratase/carnithine racemase
MRPMSDLAASPRLHVRYRPAGETGIGALRFTRPEKLNATNEASLHDLAGALDAAWADREARVVVIGGEGRGFCVGIDLHALATDSLSDSWFRRWDEELVRLEELPAPTVAALQGPCLGGGLQIALCCDLRIASDDASFGLSAVTHGIIPGLATFRLARFIGEGAAREMMLLGETWDAPRALQQGLVQRVVRQEALDAAVAGMAERLAAAPREAVRATKQLTRAAYDHPLERFLDLYAEAQARCRADVETRENLARYQRGRWGRS